MKKKSHNFIIPLVIYPFSVMVSVGENNDCLYNNLKQFTLTAEDIESAMFRDNNTKAIAVHFSSNEFMVRLKHKIEGGDDLAVLQHEIFHVVNFIMDEMGLKYETGKSDEAYAYLIEYLTKEIYSKVK